MDAKLSEKGTSCFFCGRFFILWKGKFYEYFSFFAIGNLSDLYANFYEVLLVISSANYQVRTASFPLLCKITQFGKHFLAQHTPNCNNVVLGPVYMEWGTPV